MDCTLGDMVEEMLTKHPEWWPRLSDEERTVSYNVLLADGKYFDVAAQEVKPFPDGAQYRLDEHCNVVIRAE